MGSKRKTSNEKRGNPTTKGAQKEGPPKKKEATLKHKDSKRKTSDEKVATLKCKGLKKKDLH
jgi:hypothetical protein